MKRFWRPNDRLADLVLTAFSEKLDWQDPKLTQEKKLVWSQLLLQCLEGVGLDGLMAFRNAGQEDVLFNPSLASPLGRNITRGIVFYRSLGWIEGEWCVASDEVRMVEQIAKAVAKLDHPDFNQLRSFQV